MAVTHTTVGFKGTVDQIGEARRMARLGPRGTVADAAAWKVTQASGDRVVTVAVGSGQACGVLDTTVAVDTLASLPAHSAASSVLRYDMIVARFKWTDPVTAVEFLSITGVSDAGGPDLTKLMRNPGTQYDVVLAVVRVAGGQGTLTANDIFDCRVWGGVAGALQGTTDAYLACIDGIAGQELLVAGSPGVRYRHSGTAWRVIVGPIFTIGQSTDQNLSAGLSALSQWSAVSDPYGFFSTADPLNPVVVPAGEGGLLVVEFTYLQNTVSAGRAFARLVPNASSIDGRRSVFSYDDGTTLTTELVLRPADKLKAEVFTTTAATTTSTAVRIRGYRQGA